MATNQTNLPNLPNLGNIFYINFVIPDIKLRFCKILKDFEIVHIIKFEICCHKYLSDFDIKFRVFQNIWELTKMKIFSNMNKIR